jgi:toxin ParE1/3/4
MIVAWTVDAKSDLDDIWTFIAIDNLDAADRILDRLRTASIQLTMFPKIGRSGRRSKTRELVVSGTNYVLIYRVVRDTVQVLHVRHGNQQWPPKG